MPLATYRGKDRLPAWGDKWALRQPVLVRRRSEGAKHLPSGSCALASAASAWLVSERNAEQPPNSYMQPAQHPCCGGANDLTDKSNRPATLNGTAPIVRQLLTAEDAREIDNLANRLQREYQRVDNPLFLAKVRKFAQELPLAARQCVVGLSCQDSSSGASIIRGHRVDSRLESTPSHWRAGSETDVSRRYDFLVALYCAVSGEPFGWRTQQDGRLIHDVLPIAGHENEQLGTGSQTELALHTEDAFHDNRADLLALFALRNPYRTETTIASVRWVTNLDPTLFEPRFYIAPDYSHLQGNNSPSRSESLPQEYHKPRAISILSGSSEEPFMRMDAYFTSAVDPVAARSLEEFESLMEAIAKPVILDPGDLLLVNNHLVAHGRKPYQPGFDGSDRWLKRGLCAYDLRQSAKVREGRLI